MAEKGARRVRLDTPLEPRRSLRPHYDPDAFGRVSEQIARFLASRHANAALQQTLVVHLRLRPLTSRSSLRTNRRTREPLRNRQLDVAQYSSNYSEHPVLSRC